MTPIIHDSVVGRATEMDVKRSPYELSTTFGNLHSQRGYNAEVTLRKL
jgi:hypothetical protein